MKIKQADSFYYRIGLFDTIENLSKKFNTSKENILRNNSEIPLYAGEMVIIKTNDYILHFVSPIETLKDIANKYNVDEEKICLDNDLTSNKLYIGQKLKIKIIE